MSANVVNARPTAYFSFLICFHKDHTDLFLSGTPIGVIRNGTFHLHQIITPAGNLRDTTMRDLQNLVVGGCPFDTIDELRERVALAIASMQMPPGIS